MQPEALKMKLFLLLAGVSAVLPAAPRAPNTRSMSLHADKNGGFHITIANGVFTVNWDSGESEVLGILGRNDNDDDDDKVTFDITVTFDEASGGHKITVYWDGPSNQVFEDCFDFGSKQWYGGPQQKEQYWPIQHATLQKYSIISKEDGNSAISERYWLNSAGRYFYVHPEAPLFVDYHNSLQNHICFIAEVADPYSTRRTHNVLKYDIWLFDNAKVAHQHAVNTYLGKPSDIPDYRMIKYPVWSTWARYSREIDQDTLWAFANEIKDSGFPNAQFEIDDLWEICYGSLTVDERKLPDFKKLIQDIKGLGFRVSIWVHPFINKDCNPWYSEALEKGYLVLNEEGNPDSSWWNNNGSVPGYIDFTKPEAAAWYSSRIQNLIDTYDLDTLKFDAGESSWSPQIPVQTGDIDLHPGHIVQTYVREVAKFGPAIEIRSGMRTQYLPVFVRMVDKDTYWGFNNGLATLVTTLLQMNLSGYTLVLPDMIGGNGYNDKPSKELFVRWMQANVFMPALQYSFVPWDHDDEAVEICRKYTQLHADYADKIVAAMEASVRDGTPVNAPIWWLDPADEQALATWDEYLLGQRILVSRTDNFKDKGVNIKPRGGRTPCQRLAVVDHTNRREALTIWDQYLLGEDILVAPILVENAISRDIYLPKGEWLDKGVSGSVYVYVGPTWLRNYNVPIDELAYFVRKTVPNAASIPHVAALLVALAMFLAVFSI